MIPVKRAKEPHAFDSQVRQPGVKWLNQKGIPLSGKPPSGTKLPPYWRACLGDLHADYRGICAYLCVFVESVTGGNSVDHFVAKSKNAKAAYEWRNYRLACSTMNARKGDYDTVLDPFYVKVATFRLELVTGRIYPNPSLAAARQSRARETIQRLGLDDAGCRELRARWFGNFVAKDISSKFLLEHAPFVWSEAERQRLLGP